MASRNGETSIHGKRLLLTARGLKVNGRHLPDIDTGGNVFYVNSAIGVDGGEGTSPLSPFDTLDYAIGKCTANNNDIIIVMANHAETITGAGGITADVAGITIVGIGNSNQRPRFLMDAGTSVTFLISAADVTVQNLVFASGHSGVVTCFNVTGVGATLLDLEFGNNTTNENFVTCVKATGAANTADGLRIERCRWLTTDADDQEFLEITDDLGGLVMLDNYMNTAGTASPLVLSAGTKILTGALIMRNVVQTAATSGDLLIDNGGSTGQTGIIAYNLVGNLDTSGAQVLGVATGCQFFENYATSTSTESGAVHLTLDTPIS